MTTYYTRPQDRQYQRPPIDNRSLGDLFSDLSQKATLLARQEVQLAKVEMKEKATEAGREIAIIVIGVVLANAALLALVATAVLALSMFMETWLAALIVTIVVAVVAGILLMVGINGLREMNPVPEQTVTSLKEDKEWLSRQMSK